ncbi:Auxin response factor 7 [Platanthera zijinensis]|uniref:Auxin-responsive protein n=1 Tax=Platanthera zijinensis TaxID=2320716 RepID=A0AAP0AV25_9ASPA
MAVAPPTSEPSARSKRARPPLSSSGALEFPSVLGPWKSQSDTNVTIPYPGLLQGHEPFYRPGQPANNSTAHWPILHETQLESVSAATVNTEKPTENKQEPSSGFMLFGYQLIKHSASAEDTSSFPAITDAIRYGLPDIDSDCHSNPSNINHSDASALSSEPEHSCLRSHHESQTRQTRSCTKVHMVGIAVGRAVDLTRLEGYTDLLGKLEEMFGIRGELLGDAKKWKVVYTDDEDDMMMVGDDPWHEFCRMAKKIYISTFEEAKRISPKVMSKNLPLPEAEIPLQEPADNGC